MSTTTHGSMQPITCGSCDKAFSPKRYRRAVWLFNACERLHRTCFVVFGIQMECDFVVTQLLTEWHKVTVQAHRRSSFQKTMKVLRLWSFQHALLEANQRMAATEFNAVRQCWNKWKCEALMPVLVDSSDSSNSNA